MTYTFPLTLIWPADTRVAMIHDNWRRLRSGHIEATYQSREELELCLMFAGFGQRQMELVGRQA